MLVQTCNNCGINLKIGCSQRKKEICSKWKPENASCETCLYCDECRTFGKKVSKLLVCSNYIKSKTKHTLKDDVEEPSVDLVDTILNSDYERAISEKVDDRDVQWADNPVRFISSKKFMGINLYPRQLTILAEWFAAYCPYCSDTKFIRTKVEVNTPIDEIKSRMRLYKDGICPKCGKTRYDAIQDGTHKYYDQLAGCAGQRSGKSLTCVMAALAILHEFLRLPNPMSTYKLLLNAPLSGTFVGLRYNDAFDNLWTPFYNLIKDSLWFKKYHDFLTEQSTKLSHDLFKFRDSYVSYAYKNIIIYPSGPDKRKLRGRCLPGHVLINTDRGFIPVKNYAKLLNSITFKGHEKRKIIGHCYSGRKEVIRIKTANGLELDASFDHRVLTAEFSKDIPTKLVCSWVEQQNLKDKLVFCQLGGDFPTKSPYPVHYMTRQALVCNTKLPLEVMSCSKEQTLECTTYLLNQCRIKEDAYIFPNEEMTKQVQLLLMKLGFEVKRENTTLMLSEVSKEFLLTKVISVESIGEMDVFDIEVSAEDSIYPANNILVHNTRIIGALDEVGWFSGKSDGVMYNAEEVYTALDNSLMTVRAAARKLLKMNPGLPTAQGIYISSPSSKTDAIMKMVKASKNSRNIYSFHYPTWEFNPEITKEDLADKFATDPIIAERDFGANPPYSISPYLKSPDLLIETFSDKLKNAICLTGKNIVKDSLGGNLISPKIKFKWTHSFPSVLAVDCGYTNNSFALALMHKVSTDEEFKKVITGLLEIKPSPFPISFPRIYEDVISKICDNFNVKLIAFDRWESIDFTQRAYEDFDIDAIRYSVTYSNFESLKQDIFSKYIEHPKLEIEHKKLLELEESVDSLVGTHPVSHLFLQYLVSKDTGKTIAKGEDATDDLLRAVCLGNALLDNEEFDDLFSEEGESYAKSIDRTAVIVGSLGNTAKGSSKTISGIGVIGSY